MSITPVDKPPDADEQGAGVLGGASSLRAAAHTLANRIVGRLRDAGRGLFPSDRRESDGAPLPTASRGFAHQMLDEEALRGDEEFPERDHPLTVPARNDAGINTPDVVGIETEAGLRLSIPENPDATLTSDVWTTVDP